MSARRLRTLAGAATLALASRAVAADPAAAHGLVGKQDLPIPSWLFGWTATAVLVVSFVGLATLWPTARLQERRERTLLRVPALLDPLAGVIGVVLFAIVIYAGLAGEQTDPQGNLIDTTVYVLFWVGLPFASVLFGDVFRAFNPWRAIGRFAGLVTRRVTADPPAPLPYPRRLGRWPAVVGILLFAWVELVYAHKDDPSQLAVMALAYAAVQLVGMALYGVEPWERRGDAFSVYFGLFARLSPLHWTDGELRVRRPLEGAVGLDTPPAPSPCW